MEGLNLFETEHWAPLASYGFDSPFLHINAQTVVHTWIALGILLCVVALARFALSRKGSVSAYIVTMFVDTFVDLSKQTLNGFFFGHFAFVTSLFCFIALCNVLSLIPGLEEPTRDINTTLALGLISFFYTQAYAVKVQGTGNYVKEYFKPFFIMLPLNVVGQVASIISISFRLFGNIFGGSTITFIWFDNIQKPWSWGFINNKFGILTQTLALPLNIIMIGFFVLFEGLLQAFVFAMLSLTYLSIAIQIESDTE